MTETFQGFGDAVYENHSRRKVVFRLSSWVTNNFLLFEPENGSSRGSIPPMTKTSPYMRLVHPGSSFAINIPQRIAKFPRLFSKLREG